MIDLAGADDRIRISGPHPIDGGVDLVIRNLGAMTDDHRNAFQSCE
ncbi:hypothetical protein [Sedimentitalea nanhaiensis]|nr:hypothetical protein [Sedimentitalea nanhaiensis]